MVAVKDFLEESTTIQLPDQEFSLRGSELQAVNGVFYFNDMAITSKSRFLAVMTFEFRDPSQGPPQEILPQLIYLRECSGLEEE